MNKTKNLLIAAAMTGALAAIPFAAYAGENPASSNPTVEKEGCKGKASQMGEEKDKEKCNGRTEQGAGSHSDKDKSACSGKDGCSSKDKES